MAMESQEISLETLINLLPENIRQRLFEELAKFEELDAKRIESVWTMLLERVQLGDWEEKWKCLYFCEVLLNGNVCLDEGMIMDLWDPLFVLIECILDEDITAETCTDFEKIGLHTGSLISTASSIFQKEDDQITKSSFAELKPLELSDLLSSALAIITRDNFPTTAALPAPCRQSILEFARGICKVIVFRSSDNDMRDAARNLVPQFVRFCDCTYFRTEDKDKVLHYMNCLVKVVWVTNYPEMNEFYEVFNPNVDFSNDPETGAKILASAIPFDDSGESKLLRRFLDAVCELRQINVGRIYINYCDRIVRELVDRLIERITKISSDGGDGTDLQSMIVAYFERASILYGYGNLGVALWMEKNLRYVVPALMLQPCTASSAIHKAVAKICDTNRHSLISDNISHILVRVADDPELDRSEIHVMYEFIESEGAKTDDQGREKRLPFNQYVKWHMFNCVNALATHLAAAEEVIIDMLAQITGLDEDGTAAKNRRPRQEAMTNQQLAVEVVRSRLLGILSKFTGVFSSTRSPVDERLLALRSLIRWMKILAGDSLSEVSDKIISTLRIASSVGRSDEQRHRASSTYVMEDRKFRSYVAQAWKTLLVNVNALTRKEIVLTVVVAIVPLLPSIDIDTKVGENLEELFRFIFVTNSGQLREEISQISFLSKTTESQLFSKYCPQFDDDKFSLKQLIEKTWSLFKYEHPDVKRLTLERLKSVLRRDPKELYRELITTDSETTIDPMVNDLFKSLTRALFHSNAGVRRSAAACMGDLGAIDPGRLRMMIDTSVSSTNANVKTESLVFANFDDHSSEFVKSHEFPCAVLTEVTRLLLGSSSSYDFCSWTLQQILAFYGCRDGGITKLDDLSGMIWSKLDEATRKVLTPFLSTVYKIDTMKGQTRANLPSPIFGSESASTFKDWLTNWLASLIKQVKSARAKKLFTCLLVIADRDFGFAQFLLPQVILHCVTEGDEQIREKIHDEMLAAVSGVRANGESIKDTNLERSSAHLVFYVLDFLTKWKLHVKNSVDQIPRERLKRMEEFLKLMPKGAASIRASLFDAHPRALMYYEEHYTDNRTAKEGTDEWRKQFGRLQEVYANLDDVDGVVGCLNVLKKNALTVDQEQVLAFEVTGSYTDALPFWEAASNANLGDDADKLKVHVRLTNCLLRLNQSNVCERYLSGLSRANTEWENALHPYRVEALLKLQQWNELENELSAHSNVAPSWPTVVGDLLLSVRKKDKDLFEKKLTLSRDHVLEKLSFASKDSGMCDGGYGNMLRLHMLSEIERAAQRLLCANVSAEQDSNWLDEMISEWEQRYKIVQPSMDVFYALLDLHKQILRLRPQSAKTERAVGECWLEAVKVARKTGHYQTAWNLLAQAKGFGLVETFLEEAKLLWNKDQKQEAISSLSLGINQNYSDLLEVRTLASASEERRFSFAKAQLLFANYSRETASMDTERLYRVYDYILKPEIFPNWEEGNYFAGFLLDQAIRSGECNIQNIRTVMRHYSKSLEFGSRYVHHSMPRLMTLWLDWTHQMYAKSRRLAQQATTNLPREVMERTQTEQLNMERLIRELNDIIKHAHSRIPAYQFYCCYSQLISRICHPCPSTFQILKEILANLLATYPHQCVWNTISVKRSSVQERTNRCKEIVQRAREINAQMDTIFRAAESLSELLIGVCEQKFASSMTVLSLSRDFKELYDFFRKAVNKNKIILPLQKLMDVTYPTVSPGRSPDPRHKPFNEQLLFIQNFSDRIQILASMQRPKKLSLLGSDGREYSIMCKAEDDLHLDKRLMEFTNLVNGCLLRDPEARRRELHIRSYTVTPLSEKCGFIEWVPNLEIFRNVYASLCGDFGHKIVAMRDIQNLYGPPAKRTSFEENKKIMDEKLLPKHPLLFRHWFTRTFPEPLAWYRARLNYTRTAGVMSMVGFVLGLGDRHGENILLDFTNGDVVHVDFNCLFNRGETLGVPEILPFRLTRNMIDGMGPLGCEGHFRKTCEVTLKLLRDESSMLRTVLETFLHDPLVEWNKEQPQLASSAPTAGRRDRNRPEGGEQMAKQHLAKIEFRLQGRVKMIDRQVIEPKKFPNAPYGSSMNVEGQVSLLIQQATDPEWLAQMYYGWGAYI